MNNRTISLPTRLTRIGVAIGIFVLAGLSWSLEAATTWTGAVNNDWSNPGNWTNGVPDATNGAILAGGENLSIQMPDTDINIMSLTFTAGLPGPLSLSAQPGSRFNFQAGNSITVEAGAPAITINTSGNRFLQFPGSNADSYITNNSTNLLTLNSRLSRSGSDHPNIRFNGSGDILLSGVVVSGTASRLYLEHTFTGNLIIASHMDVNNIQFTELNGGTLVLDGTQRANATRFTVNAATVTGNGRIGEHESSSTAMAIDFNEGSVVNAGRVGETGLLTFENNDVSFNTGSTMVFDLLNKDDHDKLHFARTSELSQYVLPSVALSTEGDGVALSLNLLSGFAAEVGDEFTLLSGYQAITGTFAGLEEGASLIQGDYAFLVHYGTGNTMLTVTAIPEPSFFVGIWGIVALSGYLRRGRKSFAKEPVL